METSRRKLIAAGGALAALAASGARAAPDPAPPGLMKVFHVHVGPEGKSQGRWVEVKKLPQELPVVSIQAGAIGAGDGRWGNVPSKRFSVNVAGDLRVNLGDGTKHVIGKGDLVFIEDLTGTGHFTQFLTPVANLYIIVPEDFDFLAWAGYGEGDAA